MSFLRVIVSSSLFVLLSKNQTKERVKICEGPVRKEKLSEELQANYDVQKSEGNYR